MQLLVAQDFVCNGAIMYKPSRWLFLSAIFLLVAVDCFAGQIRAYVAPFAVTGTANRDELRAALQTLLMSRLSSDTIVAVESEVNADLTISGSYLAFGKVFSLDAVAKSKEGAVLVRAFEQGESQEEMLVAAGKLAKTLASGIDKNYLQASQLPNPSAVVLPRRTAVIEPATTGPSDIIRSENARNTFGVGWISQKLAGEMTGITLGRKLGNNEREIFITGNHGLYYYLLGKEMTLQAEIALPANQKILGVDSIDLDNDGTPEIYLTVLNGNDLASQVWIPEGKTLKKVSEILPYFFRAISFQGKERKLYAQQLGRDGSYYGDLYEVARKGTSIEIKDPLKLPRGANIFNVNMLPTKDGKGFFIVLNSDGYLLVYNEKRENVWKSSDKYGGSELFLSKEDMLEMRNIGNPYKQTFLEQRLTVTKDGEIIVPKNDGFFIVGNSRSYTKNTIYAFAWNGVMLDELWHTKQSQNYLADYLYDEKSKELILLEVVLKAGILEDGASAVSIKKVE